MLEREAEEDDYSLINFTDKEKKEISFLHDTDVLLTYLREKGNVYTAVIQYCMPFKYLISQHKNGCCRKGAIFCVMLKK